MECTCFLHGQLVPNGQLVIIIYYTALLNAVERSIHLRGPSRLPVVNNFSRMTVVMHIMTAVKERHVSRMTAQVVQ